MSKRATSQSRVIFLKQCPRCRGDVHINRDMYGEYHECLQCGYMADIAPPSYLDRMGVASPDMDEVA